MVDDFDDPYLAASRRSSRIKAAVAVLLLVGVVGFFVARQGQQKAHIDGVVASSEALMLPGTFVGLIDAARLVAEEAAADELAPATLHVQGVKADLVIWALYNGAQSQAAHAADLLEAARIRGLDEPGTRLAGALFEAIRGDPRKTADLLAGAGAKASGPWAAVARAESSIRMGDVAAARAALGLCNAGICRAWSARLSMDLGDWEAAAAAADALLQESPGHPVGATVSALARGRTAPNQERVAALEAFMESTELPPRLSARVVVALSRALRRSEGPKRADELLERALEATPEAPFLVREVARAMRFQGYFGAAWNRADKALRSVPSDAGLIAELTAALYFNDAAELIEDRIEPARRANAGDAVLRGDAMVALVKGLWDSAIQGLEATRHLGEPGDSELFLAEAYIGAERYAAAVDAARRARTAFASSFGADSREAAVAAMYEGLAMGLDGDRAGAEVILEEAYRPDVRSVWGAWLYGRHHKGADRPRDAKDAYLLACHNGQDFALSCLALAQIYDSLQMDAVMRRTQQEARRQYLRQSPKGWHAARVQADLGG